MFQICTDEEIKKRLKKKKKKQLRESVVLDSEVKSTLSDEIKRLTPVKASSKIRAFDVKIIKNKAKVIMLIL